MRMQGPAAATAILLHPPAPEAPERASQASANSSIGRAIFRLPKQVIHTVFDLHTRHARRETYREGDDRVLPIFEDIRPRALWRQRVEKQQPALRRRRNPRAAEATHISYFETSWPLRCRDLAGNIRPSAPRRFHRNTIYWGGTDEKSRAIRDLRSFGNRYRQSKR